MLIQAFFGRPKPTVKKNARGKAYAKELRTEPGITRHRRETF